MIKLNGNVNYAATVVSVPSVRQLDGCDNVVCADVFGMSAIVGKDTQVGDVMIAFPTEAQLSHEFCRRNNLYRHAELNVDPTRKGYLEDNRRVRAVKFRGHSSNCLLMPLSSVAFTGVDVGSLDVGSVFDAIGDAEICRKYELPAEASGGGAVRSQRVRKSRVHERSFPQHVDTEHWRRNHHLYGDDVELLVTAKKHGSSLRLANAVVSRRLGFRDRIARLFGVKPQETEYDVIYGSRRTVKDPGNSDRRDFYGEDIWVTNGSPFADRIPKQHVVFGELVGWTPTGKPIQPKYTYGLPHGQALLLVYRVAIVTDDGTVFDLPWDDVKAFCAARGMEHVPELWRGRKADFDPEEWMNRRYRDDGLKQCLPLSDDGTVDEGVVIRIGGISPKFYKAKSSKFLEHETKLLDEGVADVESNPEAL